MLFLTFLFGGFNAPHCSYLICATPRSGSTLLCEALTNTDVAGFPIEYFETLRDTGLPRRPMEYFETWDNTEITELLGEYSQCYYEWIRLHNGIMPEGLDHTEMVLQKTKYYTFHPAKLRPSIQELTYEVHYPDQAFFFSW